MRLRSDKANSQRFFFCFIISLHKMKKNHIELISMCVIWWIGRWHRTHSENEVAEPPSYRLELPAAAAFIVRLQQNEPSDECDEQRTTIPSIDVYWIHLHLKMKWMTLRLRHNKYWLNPFCGCLRCCYDESFRFSTDRSLANAMKLFVVVMHRIVFLIRIPLDQFWELCMR